MELEKIEKIESSIENLKNKNSRIYFLVQDTKGNPKASIKYIYDTAMTLKSNGFNPIIIHSSFIIYHLSFINCQLWLEIEDVERIHNRSLLNQTRRTF